jgi:CBS domain-containing protein
MQRYTKIGEMCVRDIRHLLVETPSVVHSDASLEELLAAMIDDTQTRHVYVVDDQNVMIGSIRMNSVVEYFFPLEMVVEFGSTLNIAKTSIFSATTARDLMNPTPRFVYESTSLGEMARILMREHINELPVVDEDKHLIGQVNVYELIAAYLKESKD